LAKLWLAAVAVVALLSLWAQLALAQPWLIMLSACAAMQLAGARWRGTAGYSG